MSFNSIIRSVSAGLPRESDFYPTYCQPQRSFSSRLSTPSPLGSELSLQEQEQEDLFSFVEENKLKLSLDMSYSPIEEFSSRSIPFEKTHTIQNLTAVILSDCNIKTISADLSIFNSVQMLDISNNRLTTIPESIGKCSSLKIIRAYHNELRDLPEAITSLKGLIELDLSYNQIKTIPESIGKCSSLKIIRAGHNKIKDLPESITSLSHLTELDLSHNLIKKIPKTLLKLPSLQIVHLDENPFATTSLPEGKGF